MEVPHRSTINLEPTISEVETRAILEHTISLLPLYLSLFPLSLSLSRYIYLSLHLLLSAILCHTLSVSAGHLCTSLYLSFLFFTFFLSLSRSRFVLRSPSFPVSLSSASLDLSVSFFVSGTMGVPAFFAWLAKRYPGIISVMRETKVQSSSVCLSASSPGSHVLSI